MEGGRGRKGGGRGGTRGRAAESRVVCTARGVGFLGGRQAWARAARLRREAEDGASCGRGRDVVVAGSSREDENGDDNLEARSAVERLMKSERGEKLNKAMRDVMELKAAREAIPEDSPALQAERRRIGKLRAESIEELQDRLAEVEKAKEDLDSVGAQQEDLVALLKESTERIESLKCAVAGAGAGALFSLPLLLLDFDILSLGSAVASSALFALTYRYAVTNDVENTQLKSGVVLAFALTRGLSTLNPGHRETSTIGEVLGVALSGENIVHGIQSLLLFAFVSAALEYGFREDLLCLYGEGEITKKS